MPEPGKIDAQMATPYQLQTNTYQFGERPLQLLPAEYLAADLPDFRQPPTRGSAMRLLEAAWELGELAIARVEPALMDNSREYLDCALAKDMSAKLRLDAELLDTYHPLFRYRAERRNAFEADRQMVQGQVVDQIARDIDEQGYSRQATNAVALLNA